MSFFQQKLHSIGLKNHYLPELLSAQQLNLKDNEGNTLALYESDYKKLKKYSAQQGLKLEILTASQLLDAINSSEVKVIKYFSYENLKRCELKKQISGF